MYGCESWTIRKAEHQRTDAFELWWWTRHLRVPWIEKEIKPINPKGNESWIFIGRTDAEAESPIFWPPDKNWLIEKDPEAGKDWRQVEKGITQDGMVGWHPTLMQLICDWEEQPRILSLAPEFTISGSTLNYIGFDMIMINYHVMTFTFFGRFTTYGF